MWVNKRSGRQALSSAVLDVFAYDLVFIFSPVYYMDFIASSPLYRRGSGWPVF